MLRKHHFWKWDYWLTFPRLENSMGFVDIGKKKWKKDGSPIVHTRYSLIVEGATGHD